MNIPLHYSLEDAHNGIKWQCHHCSGAGKAPTYVAAIQTADTHYRSFHTSQETTVNPTPKRRRPGWWHAIARLITAPNTPRRAER